MSRTATTPKFQTKDAIELESCKQTKILYLLMPDEVKTFSGSLVLDLRIW